MVSIATMPAFAPTTPQSIHSTGELHTSTVPITVAIVEDEPEVRLRFEDGVGVDPFSRTPYSVTRIFKLSVKTG